MEETEFKALVEEYQICREDASRLESQIWKTSTILGLSSATGLVLKLQSELTSIEHFYIITAIAVLIITASLVWWRLSRRWWSIQHVKYRRMNDLEAKLGFKHNSSINCADTIAMSHIRYKQKQYKTREILTCINSYIWYDVPTWIEPELSSDKNLANHEHRGNQPALKLLVLVNIILWVVVVFAKAIQLGSFWETAGISGVYFFVALLFWRKP